MAKNEVYTGIELARKYTISSTLRMIFIAINEAVSILYFIIVIRDLPLLDVSIIGKASILLTIATSLAPLGLFYAANHIIPQKLREGKIREAIRLSKRITVGGTLTSSVFSIATVIVLSNTILVPMEVLYLTIIAILVNILYMYLNKMNVAWLRLSRFIILDASKLLATYSTIIVLYLLLRDIRAVFYGWILGPIVLLPLLLRKHPLTSTEEKPRNENDGNSEKLVDLIIYGFPVYLNSVLLMINQWFDKIYTSIFLVGSLFAIYFVMSRIAVILNNALLSFRSGMLSVLSYMIKEDENKVTRANRTLFDVFFFIFLGLTIILFQYSYIIVDILLGEQYAPGAPILSILFLAVFLRGFYILLQGVPAAYKKIKKLPIITLLVLGIRFLLYTYMLQYGGVGIAIATAISEGLGVVILYTIFRKLFKLKRKPYIKTIAVATMIFALTYYKTNNLVIDMAIAAAALAIYFAVGGLIRVLSDDDIRILIKAKIPIINHIVKIIAKLGRYKA